MIFGTGEERLRKALMRALSHLERRQETFWSGKIRAAIEGPIEPEEVLSWFGGMGSFGDVEIEGKGEFEPLRMVRSLWFELLRNRVYNLAWGMSRTRRSGGGRRNAKTLFEGQDALKYIEKKNLREVRQDDRLWQTEYADDKTGERWILDYPHSGLQGGGSPRLRRIES
jgi:hypothetical protein